MSGARRWTMYLIALGSAGLLAVGSASASDNKAFPKDLPPAAAYDLHLIMDRIESKFRRGKTTERELVGELLALDTLIAHYAGSDGETASKLMLFKAQLYSGPLNQPEAGLRQLLELQQMFPDSSVARGIDAAIARARQSLANGGR